MTREQLKEGENIIRTIDALNHELEQCENDSLRITFHVFNKQNNGCGYLSHVSSEARREIDKIIINDLKSQLTKEAIDFKKL
jgi:hypothetical protein